jgi:alpha-glucuronidase
MKNFVSRTGGLLLAGLMLAGSAMADDGYKLWLRYNPLPSAQATAWKAQVKSVMVPGSSATLNAVRKELVDGCSGLLGTKVSEVDQFGVGVVVAGTPESVPMFSRFESDLAELGPEGYLIRSRNNNGRSVVMIASQTEVGALNRAER